MARVEVRRDGHAMVRRFRVFHAWATAACAQMLGVDRMHGTRTISTLLAGAGEDGLVGEPRSVTDVPGPAASQRSVFADLAAIASSSRALAPSSQV